MLLTISIPRPLQSHSYHFELFLMLYPCPLNKNAIKKLWSRLEARPLDRTHGIEMLGHHMTVHMIHSWLDTLQQDTSYRVG
jgi:hypothetical protein